MKTLQECLIGRLIRFRNSKVLLQRRRANRAQKAADQLNRDFAIRGRKVFSHRPILCIDPQCMIALDQTVIRNESVNQESPDGIVVLFAMVELKQRKEETDAFGIELSFDNLPYIWRDLGKCDLLFGVQAPFELAVWPSICKKGGFGDPINTCAPKRRTPFLQERLSFLRGQQPIPTERVIVVTGVDCQLHLRQM